MTERIEEIEAREKAAAALVDEDSLASMARYSPAAATVTEQLLGDISYLLAQLRDTEEKLEAAKELKRDFNALLRDVHKQQYRQTVLDYPPADSNGNCHSLCRHVFLIKSELDRILKGGE